MYRIQKAVIKAKKGSGAEKTIKRTPRAPTESPLENLEYTQTQVIEAHPDELESQRIVAGFANAPQAQIFRTLRTQIIQKMRKNQWRSIGITSASDSEGKSLIATNLAIAIAREVNQTVLLVDLNLTQPKLANCFGIKPEKGLSDYLKGDASIEDIMINPGVERLVLIPGHDSLMNSSEVISSPKMVSFFQETKNRYKSRIIIYDMPPILPTDDVLSCVQNVDSTLLVVEDGRNSKKDIERSMRLIKGAPFLGYIINKFHRGSWLI